MSTLAEKIEGINELLKQCADARVRYDGMYDTEEESDIERGLNSELESLYHVIELAEAEIVREHEVCPRCQSKHLSTFSAGRHDQDVVAKCRDCSWSGVIA